MALTYNVERKMMSLGYMVSVKARDNKTFYQGGLVNVHNGYLVSASDTASHKFAGIVAEQTEVTSREWVKIIRNCVVKMPMKVTSYSIIGSDVFATADDTLSTSATNVKRCGVIVAIPENNMVIVDMTKSL